MLDLGHPQSLSPRCRMLDVGFGRLSTISVALPGHADGGTPGEPSCPGRVKPTHHRPLLAAGLALAAATLAISAQPDRAYRVYVSNEQSGDVSVIDGHAFRVVETIPVGPRPRGLHLSADGATLYVATSARPPQSDAAHSAPAGAGAPPATAGGIAIVDLATGKRIRQLPVGSTVENFALSRDGQHVFVAQEEIATASLWELGSGREIARAPVAETPTGIALHPRRDEAWVTCEETGDVFVLNSETGKRLGELRLGGRPRTITFAHAGDRAYVALQEAGAVAIVDADVYQLIERVAFAGSAVPPASAISPDGAELYVSTGRGNRVVILDTQAPHVVGNIRVGNRPRGLALSPNGALLFVANSGSDDVSVIDVRARKELRRIKVGDRPWGMAVR